MKTDAILPKKEKDKSKTELIAALMNLSDKLEAEKLRLRDLKKQYQIAEAKKQTAYEAMIKAEADFDSEFADSVLEQILKYEDYK